MNSGPKVAIIGAGLTGLSCAFHLEKANIRPEIYEKELRVGGRLRTEKIQGFTLDSGFQVVMTSYPEFRSLFNLKQLQLSPFFSGAMIRNRENQWTPLYHPLLHPIKSGCAFVKSPKQITDFTKLLYHYYCYRTKGNRWEFATTSTEDFLTEIGIADLSIERFFRPFFGGVFLEKGLQTQAAMFMRRFHYFLWGRACLPAEGMEAIPRQLAERLKKTSLHFNCEVTNVDGKKLEFSDGKKASADVTVCALDSPSVQKLFPGIPCHASCSTKCLYYSVPAQEVSPSKLIMLGDEESLVNTLSLNSCVQKSYAPKGQHLLCASIVDKGQSENGELEDAVKNEIAGWLNVEKRHLNHIRTYDIPHALPMQDHPPPLTDYHHPRIGNVYLAGEVVDGASINAALASGRKMAQRIIRDLEF